MGVLYRIGGVWCILFFSVFIAGVLSCNVAYADDLDGIPTSYSGTCHIGDTWEVGDQSYFNVSGFDADLSSGTSVGSWHCIDHTAAAPENVDASYTATLTNYSVSEGWLEYTVTIVPPGVTDGVSRDSAGRLYGYQRVQGTLRIPHDFNGKLKLKKSSANTSITNNNGCYSIADAVYGVYKNAACSDDTGLRLTTGSDGLTNEVELSGGTYWVKEITAPKGYFKDTSAHKVDVSAGDVSTVEVSDKPGQDPVGVVTQKVDPITGNVAQGGASLEGAEFTVCYYDGYYRSKRVLPSTPTRTWVFKTDEDGYVFMLSDYRIGGDVLYKQSGLVTVPLGTITVQETKAPAGYRLKDADGDDPDLNIATIELVNNRTQVIPQNYSAPMTVNNTPIVKDLVAQGDIRLQKGDYDVQMARKYAEEGYAYDIYDDGSVYPEGDAVLEGAVFGIYNRTGGDVASPQYKDSAGNPRLVPNGELVCTVTTDSKGWASTRRHAINGWSLPADWPSEYALAFGKYEVRELSAPEGYLLNRNWRGVAEIFEHGQEVRANDVRGSLTV